MATHRNINTSKLDNRALELYLRDRVFLERVASWFLVADRTHVHDLFRAKQLIEKTQSPARPPQIYRGVGNAVDFQDLMGLETQSSFIFFKKIKSYPKHSQHTYLAPGPLSFSSNLEIAKAFGDTIVVAVSIQQLNLLVLTDEFMMALCIVTKQSPKTQDEVIVLPDEHGAVRINFEIVASNGVGLESQLPPSVHW